MNSMNIKELNRDVLVKIIRECDFADKEIGEIIRTLEISLARIGANHSNSFIDLNDEKIILEIRESLRIGAGITDKKAEAILEKFIFLIQEQCLIYNSASKIKKVYIASPLFNPKEREENQEIDTVLKQAGYNTFLPQRDGFLFLELIEEIKKQGYARDDTEKIALNLITYLDVYQVCEGCDATVLNLNGRVPDEGAVSEGALAFRSERFLVIYKQDVRSLAMGNDNPLVVGLAGFEIAKNITEIPLMLRKMESRVESPYSKMMAIARRLFENYDPKNKKIVNLIQEGKHLFS